jgi:putative ABC transport system ATP-binding protein
MIMTSLLNLKNIGKTYKTDGVGQTVLRDINIEISAGEYVAIVGASGSGKSTLLNILGCLETPTTGTYFIDGIDTSAVNDDQLANIRGKMIGFVFQSFNLLKSMRIIDNVALPAIYTGMSRSQAGKLAKEQLERVGMLAYAERYPNQLSGGQQQRCAIARSLINKPRLLLADEPTGNLDSTNTDIVIDLLNELNESEGLTIVVVTHEDIVSNSAKRIITIKDGSMQSDVVAQAELA